MDLKISRISVSKILTKFDPKVTYSHKLYTNYTFYKCVLHEDQTLTCMHLAAAFIQSDLQ